MESSNEAAQAVALNVIKENEDQVKNEDEVDKTEDNAPQPNDPLMSQDPNPPAAELPGDDPGKKKERKKLKILRTSSESFTPDVPPPNLSSLPGYEWLIDNPMVQEELSQLDLSGYGGFDMMYHVDPYFVPSPEMYNQDYAMWEQWTQQMMPGVYGMWEQQNYYGRDRNYNKGQQRRPQKKIAKEPVKIAIPKRLLDTEKMKEQELQEALGPIKKEVKYTLDQLIAMEAEVLAKDPSYTKVDRTRESLNIVFIGHVDSGKSTLSGRILLDTGEVDENDVRKFEQEAKEKHRENWYLAYILDVNEEERQKGKTVECGKAHFALNKRRFTLLDAPGHKNYVPNMIMGASQADVAGLVLSAKTGEFESGFDKGGQTQEHALLAKSLGVQTIICIVTKMDTVNWDEQRYMSIKTQVGTWLKDVIGFPDVLFVPVDGFNGENLKTRLRPGVGDWYKNGSLFEVLDDLPVPERNPEGPIRIPIMDKMKDVSLFLFGKVESGTIRQDMWVTAMPDRKPFKIDQIFNAKDQKLFYASTGENIKIKVKELATKDEDRLERGGIICSTDDFCHVTSLFIAKLNILELPEHKKLVTSGFTSILHLHTAVQEIQIASIDTVYDSEGKADKNAKFLMSDRQGIVKIFSPQNLCLEKFEAIPQLGMFTLRDEQKTLGYGQVLKIKPAYRYQSLLAEEQKASEGQQGKSTDANTANGNGNGKSKPQSMDVESSESASGQDNMNGNSKTSRTEDVSTENISVEQ